ncbi:MAG: sulfatase [Bacteroidota bacterium]
MVSFTVFKKCFPTLTRILGLIFLTVFSALLFQCKSGNQSFKKPNIVVFLSDDLGYKDIAVYGAKVVKTPTLDQLAGEGITFNNAFVASPSCAPSRAALLTGLMPARNGAEVNHSFPKSDSLYLVKKLQENGYKVYAFGKVNHYGGNEKCGFDFHKDQQVNLYRNVSQYFDSVGISQPVCIFIGDRRPHVPWTKEMIYDTNEVDLPEYFIDTKPTREHRSRYYTDITQMDQEMGQILDYLEPKLGENILTLFTSDHGGQWPFGKWNLYDDGIRTPLIIKWPGKIEPGIRSDAFISWIDIFPTLLDITGSEIPDDLDGKTFLSELEEPTDAFRKEIYTTHTGDGRLNVYPIRSIRTEKYKFIINLLPDYYHSNHSDVFRKDGAGAYWDSWDEVAKSDSVAAAIIMKYYQRPAFEFFNLEKDPNEQMNLANDPEYTQIIDEMKQKLFTWMDTQGDQRKVYEEPYPVSGPLPRDIIVGAN